MEVRRFLPAVGLALLTVAGCQDTEARRQIGEVNTRLESAARDIQQLKDWLGTSPTPQSIPRMKVHDWHVEVFEAICALEKKANIPMGNRLCPEDDRDHNAPPKPPPFE